MKSNYNAILEAYHGLDQTNEHIAQFLRTFPVETWEDGLIDGAALPVAGAVIFATKCCSTGKSLTLVLRPNDAHRIGVLLQDAAAHSIELLLDRAAMGREHDA